MKRILIILTVILSNMNDSLGICPPQQNTFEIDISDSIASIHFIDQYSYFLVPFKYNKSETDKLQRFVEKYQADIVKGAYVFQTIGYSQSMNSKEKNLKLARIRTSHVKSYMITHFDLKEENFSTQNYPYASPEGGDMTIVELNPPSYKTPMSSRQAGELGTFESIFSEFPTCLRENHALLHLLPAPSLTRINLKTNLLYWLALTPNLEAEVYFSHQWAISVEGAWTHWDWGKVNNPKLMHQRYISPEVRYFFDVAGDWTGWYAGAYYQYGKSNRKTGLTGRQGFFQGGGITGGYVIELSKHFNFDFGIGLGYLHHWYTTYQHDNGYYKPTGKDKTDYFGPTKLKASLIWKLK